MNQAPCTRTVCLGGFARTPLWWGLLKKTSTLTAGLPLSLLTYNRRAGFEALESEA